MLDPTLAAFESVSGKGRTRMTVVCLLVLHVSCPCAVDADSEELRRSGLILGSSLVTFAASFVSQGWIMLDHDVIQRRCLACTGQVRHCFCLPP